MKRNDVNYKLHDVLLTLLPLFSIVPLRPISLCSASALGRLSFLSTDRTPHPIRRRRRRRLPVWRHLSSCPVSMTSRRPERGWRRSDARHSILSSTSSDSWASFGLLQMVVGWLHRSPCWSAVSQHRWAQPLRRMPGERWRQVIGVRRPMTSADAPSSVSFDGSGTKSSPDQRFNTKNNNFRAPLLLS